MTVEQTHDNRKSPSTYERKDALNIVFSVLQRQLGFNISEQKTFSDGSVELYITSLSSSIFNDYSNIHRLIWASFIDECCSSSKAIIKGAEGDIHINTSESISLTDFSTFASLLPLTFTELPDDPTVALIVQMVYPKILKRLKKENFKSANITDASSSVTIIKNFPKCFLTEGNRTDLVLKGDILFSLNSSFSSSKAALRVFTETLNNIVNCIVSSDFLAGILPQRWEALRQCVVTEKENIISSAPSSSFTPSSPATSYQQQQLHLLSDLLDESQAVIHDYWTDSSQTFHDTNLVCFLMSAIGGQICEYFALKISLKSDESRGMGTKGGNVFNAPETLIEQARDYLEDWETICNRMMNIDWGANWRKVINNNAYNNSNSKLFKDLATLRIRKRLTAVTDIFAFCHEARDLLGNNDFYSLSNGVVTDINENKDNTDSSNSTLYVFNNINIFDPTDVTEEAWRSAMENYNRLMEPLEHKCANKLRDFFKNSYSLSDGVEGGNDSAALSVQGILSGQMQYSHVMRRPVVSRGLSNERAALLGKLSERLRSLTLVVYRRLGVEDEGVNGEEGSSHVTVLAVEDDEERDRREQTGRYMSATVNRIMWLRQVKNKVRNVLQTTQLMFSTEVHAQGQTGTGGDPSGGEIQQGCRTLLSKIDEAEEENMKNWVLDVSDHSRELTLDAKSKIMDITHAGKVQVNFPERLVELIREVRVFNSLGFPVPRDIINIVQQGNKFYPLAVTLKEIANIYNNMDSDIIESTRAMLLEPALVFEKVICGADRKLKWRNTEETEQFIERLRKASNALVADNRRLHRLHREMGVLVLELFKLDLLRFKDQWMGRVRQIRDMIAFSNFSSTDAWTTHWDIQIFKALEYQYQIGLDSLHIVIGDIHADVVFHPGTGKATLRPPLEQIRAQYYQQVKEFVTLPSQFTGVGGNIFFRRMPAMNHRGILSIVQRAGNMFKRIEKELKRFTPMLMLARSSKNGAYTLEQMVEGCLKEVHQWESAYRLLKQKGREVSAIENFIKIDCINLSTAGIKGTMEEYLSKLAQALNISLRRSAQGHLLKIDEFLSKADESMGSKLTKLEEVRISNLIAAGFQSERPQIEAEWHQFFAKNKLCQSLTNGMGVDFVATKTKWTSFISRLDGHEKEIEGQLNSMKQQVNTLAQGWLKELQRFAAQWNELKPKDVATKNATQFVAERKKQLEELKQKGQEVAQQCQYFQLDKPDTELLEELEAEINSYEEMWALFSVYANECNEIEQYLWQAFRNKLGRLEDFVRVWLEKLKEFSVSGCSKVSNTANSNTFTMQIRTTVDDWQRGMPLLKLIRGDGFMPIHWQELFTILQLDGVSESTVTVGQLLSKVELMLRSEKKIKDIYARAQGEAQIRKALDDVSWVAEIKFTLAPHPERKGIMLITDWKDLINTINDNQALLYSIKDSPFYAPFAEDASRWENRLALIDELLHYMNAIQRKWVYLEPIFAKGALPQEQDRFNRMDRDYYYIMKEVEAHPKVMTLSDHPEYKEKFKRIRDEFEWCQKALNEYLEHKRDKFSRFYFISDDDLLEILAQSKNPVIIQSHLKKLFMGIYSVKFDPTKKYIVQMLSSDGEVVSLHAPVAITDQVEEWLDALDREMKVTLQQNVLQCLDKLDVGAYASQILCTCEQMNFTKRTEESITHPPDGLRKHKADLQAQLKEFTTFCARNNDVVMGLKMKALIMDFIHYIEVASLLITGNITTITDWPWTKQLRFYLGRESKCIIRMVDALFQYNYEYQGNAPKLVHTPLTDSCYLTLTQGMHLGYGGNSYGPAGTGKTESVKALGNALGRQVLVFNCDEGIDFKGMGRIFTGILKCGAWGCFDEFNRLKVDQLSAVSQMISVIQEALKGGERTCNLLGRDIGVNPHAGIFVTLNPAGKGYGGRSKLPDNLKQLFRSVAMSTPDNDLIAETILYSEGFENATILAKKTTEIFKLAKELLSSQQHYDWGLRALKSVLRLGGDLIHKYIKEKADKNIQSTHEEVLKVESEVIIKSLRVNTMSKLTFDDRILFDTLLEDIFPGVEIHDIIYAEIQPAIIDAIKELKYQVVQSQVDKILQLYEALNQRMGVVLVGPSGSGKSTLLKFLRRALNKLGVKVPLYAVNPKAMPRDQLLGHMHSETREWFDGVITDAAKKVVKEPAEGVRSWILCDGAIDPEWIESLNSVLDDNKLLTMPTGVRIQFGSNVNFIFETDSLQFASPATVSRMGVIFLSEEDVDLKTAVATWLSEEPEEIRGQLSQWIDTYLYRAINTLIGTKSLVVETTRTGLVHSALCQLQNCTNKLQFAQGLIYGLGSYLFEDKRLSFTKQMLELCGERSPDTKNPLNWNFNPTTHLVDVFKYESPFNLQVDHLSRIPMIHTVECQRNICIMNAWTATTSKAQLTTATTTGQKDTTTTRSGGSELSGGGGAMTATNAPPTYRPFILVGPEGCGKSMLCESAFSQIPSARVVTLNCSVQTVAAHAIQKLKLASQLFNTNTGKVLRPKDAERLILFVKDLNLPKPDMYDTVQLHSLLQQLIIYKGFYDTDLEWVQVERLQIVGSMSPPGSMGRYPVARRLMAIVSILAISYPTKECLCQIYTEIINLLLQSPSLQKRAVLPVGKGPAEVARGMTAVYDALTKKFSVDDVSHYIFNLRDLTQWALGLLAYNPADASSNGFVSILKYEARRIFSDRMVTSEETRFVDKLITESFANLASTTIDDGEKTRLYVSWMDLGAKDRSNKRHLCEVKRQDLKKSVEDNLHLYMRENFELKIQLIDEVLSGIARVDRVLSQDFGNMTLVSSAGVCALEIVRLVTYMNRMELFTFNMMRDYSKKNFEVDLRNVIQLAGVNGTPATLFLEDINFAHNSTFLEMVNSLLSNGEIPGLYTMEEIDSMLAPLKEEAAAGGFDSTYSYFVYRTRKYLHVVIIMDPTNSEYERWCRSNPALFARCTVNWMGSWAPEALRLLSKIMMPSVHKLIEERDGFDKDTFNLSSEMVNIHINVGAERNRRSSIGVPGSSIHLSTQDFKFFCEAYEFIFNKKRNNSDEAQKRYNSGLDKIAEAEANVGEISRDVLAKKSLMEEKQKEADDVLVEIQKQMEEASRQKLQIQKIQKDIDADHRVVEDKKRVIEGKLSHIQPVLDAACAAVGSIKSEHIAELKAMKQPPQAVQDVLEGVLTLLGHKDSAWTTGIRKWLAGDCRSAILGFDVHGITPTIRSNVEKYLASNKNSFKKDVITRASRAAAPMAEWLQANLEYSAVLDAVQPLTEELDVCAENLDKVQNRKSHFEEKIQQVEHTVGGLQRNFEEKTKEAERLKYKLELVEKTLNNAEELIGKLTGEKQRWSAKLKEIGKDVTQMSKRVLIATAVLTYLGSEIEDVRYKMLKKWKDQLKVDDFNFFTFMRPESAILQYKSEGLPGDDLSIDNAVMIMDQVRTVFIVDPASQATEWFKNHCKANGRNVETIGISDARLINTMELAMRFGKTLMITDVDNIEAFLYPLLRKEIHTEGSKHTIQFGDRRSIDYSDSFQLILVTSSTVLRIPPSIACFLNEINFSITHSGLVGQLLSVIIQHEQPKLEEERLQLLQGTEELQLAALEEALLQDLASSKGSLLQNPKLIENLNQIKTQANNIEEALAKSKEIQHQLNEKRDVYCPLAVTGATMFFLMKNLVALNHMYQFGLGIFLSVFQQVLNEMKDDYSHPEKKMNILSERMGQSILYFVTRGLLKEHRVIFAINLAGALNSSLYTQQEWEFFVDTAVVPDTKRGEVRMPNWILPECRSVYQNLAVTLPELVSHLSLHESDVWYNWMRAPAPEESYPVFLNKMTGFQKLLAVKALRPDRLIAAMNRWACETLHVPCLSDNSTLAAIVRQAVNTEPLLLIATPGADASIDLQNVAYETVGRDKFVQVAMGDGRQEEALKLLKQCAQEGSWLCLKNLHLVVSWVSTLQKEFNLLTPHPQFRLWLTSEPHDEFPSVLLSNSLKITFEAPPGIKQNLIRTFNTWDEKMWNSIHSNIQKELLFILAFFHATVVERCFYYPQGWAQAYEFSASDIKSATDIVLQQSVHGNVNWRTIHGVLDSAIYGGRMETFFDVRILRTYLNDYFHPNKLPETTAGSRQLYRDIVIPKTGERGEFLRLVESLPDNDIPAMFRLPPNADRVVQAARVSRFTEDLQRLHEHRVVGKMTRSQWAASLQPLLTTWRELYDPYADFLGTAHPRERDAKPIEGFITDEQSATVRLVKLVDHSMRDLQRVINGTLLLSEQVKSEAATMLQGDVPSSWDGFYPTGPERITSWLASLIDKAVAIQRWYEQSSDGSLLRSQLNLSNLFRPIIFLDTLRQETAHRTKVPLIDLCLISRIGVVPPGVPLSVCLEGLLLQGAVLASDGFLSDINSADSAGFLRMPYVYVAWVPTKQQTEEFSGSGHEKTIVVPVYVNATKRNLLTELRLKCRSEVDVDKFMLAGVSIMLE